MIILLPGTTSAAENYPHNNDAWLDRVYNSQTPSYKGRQVLDYVYASGFGEKAIVVSIDNPRCGNFELQNGEYVDSSEWTRTPDAGVYAREMKEVLDYLDENYNTYGSVTPDCSCLSSHYAIGGTSEGATHFRWIVNDTATNLVERFGYYLIDGPSSVITDGDAGETLINRLAANANNVYGIYSASGNNANTSGMSGNGGIAGQHSL